MSKCRKIYQPKVIHAEMSTETKCPHAEMSCRNPRSRNNSKPKKFACLWIPPLSMVLLQIAPDWNPYQVLHRWLPSCVQLGSGLLAYQSTVKQDADGGSLQDKAQILWRLKAEGVVGFYGQKSPSDKGTSAYLHRMISLFFAPLFLLNRYGISNSTS